MTRGFISDIKINEDGSKEVIILLENHHQYIVPYEMLPFNIEIDDFIIIDNGRVSIDPESDEKKELILQNLEKFIK